MIGRMYDQDQDGADQQQQAAPAPAPARAPAMRIAQGGPGYPHIIGSAQPVVVLLEVDGTPGSSVDVSGVVKLANNAWWASGRATIPPEGAGPGFASLVFQSMPTDLPFGVAMGSGSGFGQLELTAISSDGQVGRTESPLTITRVSMDGT